MSNDSNDDTPTSPTTTVGMTAGLAGGAAQTQAHQAVAVTPRNGDNRASTKEGENGIGPKGIFTTAVAGSNKKQNLKPITVMHFNASVLMLYTYIDPKNHMPLSLDINANTINTTIAAKIQNSLAGNPLNVSTTKANTAASSMVSVLVTNMPTDYTRCEKVPIVSKKSLFFFEFF